jgi:hypothetical protein
MRRFHPKLAPEASYFESYRVCRIWFKVHKIKEKTAKQKKMAWEWAQSEQAILGVISRTIYQKKALDLVYSMELLVMRDVRNPKFSSCRSERQLIFGEKKRFFITGDKMRR